MTAGTERTATGCSKAVLLAFACDAEGMSRRLRAGACRDVKSFRRALTVLTNKLRATKQTLRDLTLTD